MLRISVTDRVRNRSINQYSSRALSRSRWHGSILASLMVRHSAGAWIGDEGEEVVDGDVGLHQTQMRSGGFGVADVDMGAGDRTVP